MRETATTVDVPHPVPDAECDEQATDSFPLADRCSLCGGGYEPHREIDIASVANKREHGENQGRVEFRWAHIDCITGERGA